MTNGEITNWLATHLYKPHPRNDTQIDGAWAPNETTFDTAWRLEPDFRSAHVGLAAQYVSVMHARPTFGGEVIYPDAPGGKLFGMDENHVCLSMLVSVAIRLNEVGGENEALISKAAAKEFIDRALDYWDNDSSYFRDGYATMPPRAGDWYLGWTGRCRKAAIILRILADAVDLMRAFPKYQAWANAVQNLASFHLGKIIECWPLVDAGQSDGMSEDEHFRQFQVALLYFAAKRVRSRGFSSNIEAQATQVMGLAAGVLAHAIFLHADNTPFTPYDIKWPDWSMTMDAVGFKPASSVEIHLCGITPELTQYVSKKYASEPKAVKLKYGIA